MSETKEWCIHIGNDFWMNYYPQQGVKNWNYCPICGAQRPEEPKYEFYKNNPDKIIKVEEYLNALPFPT